MFRGIRTSRASGSIFYRNKRVLAGQLHTEKSLILLKSVFPFEILK